MSFLRLGLAYLKKYCSFLSGTIYFKTKTSIPLFAVFVFGYVPVIANLIGCEVDFG